MPRWMKATVIHSFLMMQMRAYCAWKKIGLKKQMAEKLPYFSYFMRMENGRKFISNGLERWAFQPKSSRIFTDTALGIIAISISMKKPSWMIFAVAMLYLKKKICFKLTTGGNVRSVIGKRMKRNFPAACGAWRTVFMNMGIRQDYGWRHLRRKRTAACLKNTRIGFYVIPMAHYGKPAETGAAFTAWILTVSRFRSMYAKLLKQSLNNGTLIW